VSDENHRGPGDAADIEQQIVHFQAGQLVEGGYDFQAIKQVKPRSGKKTGQSDS